MRSKAKAELKIGDVVQFCFNGFRLGRIRKIGGNTITVVLAPFGFKGKRKGEKVRIKAEDINGLIYRKKVIEWHI